VVDEVLLVEQQTAGDVQVFATYKLNDANTIGINGGTHFSDFDASTRSPRFQFATIHGPLA
jgi:hypothetical protein